MPANTVTPSAAVDLEMPEKSELCYNREEGWLKGTNLVGKEDFHASQVFSTPNTTFNLTVSELHSVIPLGRTAGALREGWTGIMRDHLRRIIPHTTWYFKRSAFSHPDTRKRAAPLFKCEAVCAERSCPNTIKMCATKADPLRVSVNFGQNLCVHMVRRKVFHPTLNNTTNTFKEEGTRTKSSLKRSLSRSPETPSFDIKRPVAVRLVDRRSSFCRLRSIENAPSAFHVVSLPPRIPDRDLKQEYFSHYSYTSNEMYKTPSLCCYTDGFGPKRQKVEMITLVS